MKQRHVLVFIFPKENLPSYFLFSPVGTQIGGPSALLVSFPDKIFFPCLPPPLPFSLPIFKFQPGVVNNWPIYELSAQIIGSFCCDNLALFLHTQGLILVNRLRIVKNSL